MKLGSKQELFTEALAILIQVARLRGFTVRLGEVERSKEEATRKGFAQSNHVRRLAADVHLFRDHRYLSKTSDHEQLGVFWESLTGEYNGQHVEFCWGGRFSDGNHYSIRHGKIK